MTAPNEAANSRHLRRDRPLVGPTRSMSDILSLDPADRARLLAVEFVDAMVALASSLAAPASGPEQLLGLNNIAKRLSLSRSMVQRMRRSGELDAIKVGRRYLVRVSEVERFIAAQETHGRRNGHGVR